MFLFQVFFREKIENYRVKQDADESQSTKPCISANHSKYQFKQIKQADWLEIIVLGNWYIVFIFCYSLVFSKWCFR